MTIYRYRRVQILGSHLPPRPFSQLTSVSAPLLFSSLLSYPLLSSPILLYPLNGLTLPVLAPAPFPPLLTPLSIDVRVGGQEAMEWYQGDLQQAVVAEDWPKVRALRTRVCACVYSASSMPTGCRAHVSRPSTRPKELKAVSGCFAGCGGLRTSRRMDFFSVWCLNAHEVITT